MRTEVSNTQLVELMRSEEALTQYQDPEALAARRDLTDEERERLKAKDMGWPLAPGGRSVQFSHSSP